MIKKSKINMSSLQNREYVLAKNIREELNVIPDNYVIEYYPKKDDVSSLVIEVPSVININGNKTPYPLFEQILHRRHILIKQNDECLERFVIEEIEEVESKGLKVKTATAYSYDYTLKTKACLIGEGLTRQLYCPKDETVHVGEGILNIFESQTGWKVNHIDDMARHEEVVENVSVTNSMFGEINFDKVIDDMTLLDMDIIIPHEERFPLSFDIAWVDLNVTTADGFSYNAGSIIHSFSNYHNSVTHIKATFTSNSTQRYGVTYELTFADNTTEKVVYAFVNCRNLSLSIKGINLTYLTSEEENKRVVKYRYLEYSQSYWYQYLKTTVQDAYDVYISFDSYNKTINVYDKEQFGKWKGFYLDFDNLLTKITKQSDSSELCTRLWIQSNNVDITEVNPLGTSYIEDYSYFEQDNTMSDSLKNALKRYYEHIQIQQEKWSEISKLKNVSDQWITKRNSELTSLNEQVKAKQALLTAYLKTNNNSEGQERVARELKELEMQVTEKLAQIHQLQAQSDEYLSQMQLIGMQMAKETSEDSQGMIFTSVDLEELNDLTIEQTYTDEFYTKASGLFEYAKKVMESKTKLTYEFSLEHEELVSGIKHPLGWEWFIEIGAKVEIPDKNLADKDGFVSIYAYKYSPKNKIIESVEFNNDSAVTKAIKGLASFSKIAYDTANMTDFWKETWKESENATAIVSDIRKNGLDLAANMVRGGNTVNKISLTESGVFVIDAENDDNQIYIGSSLIAITTDRWVTSQTAIDHGGVIADTIVGRLLLGEQLFLSNEDGSFTILPDKISIKDSIQEEIIGIGIGDSGNTYLHLGKDTDNSYLIFKENGELDIKASSLRLTTGEIPTAEDIENIKNEGYAYTNAQLEVLEKSITSRVESVEHRQETSEEGLQELNSWKSYAEQKITDSSIINTVSQTVESAKTEAINSANSSTDGKLVNYYTKTEANSKIEQKANEVSLSVAKNEVSNLQIGGANLYDRTKVLTTYRGSNLTRTETGFSVHGIFENDANLRVSNVIDSNGWYTISFFARVGSVPWDNHLEINDIVIGTIDLTTEFKYFKFTHYVENYTSDVYNFVDFEGLSAQTYDIKNFKVEKGNKATDYSPSFVDINNSIAKMEIKADEIASTVAKQEIRNMQFGVENLLLGTSDFTPSTVWYNAAANFDGSTFKGCKAYYVTSDWAGMQYNTKDLINRSVLQAGVTYTISCYAIAGATGISGGFYSGGFGSIRFDELSTNWTQYSFTFTPTQEQINSVTDTVKILFEPYDLTGTGHRVYVACYKLERGNKATDYIKSSEDLPTTSEMNSAINQKANEITSTVTQTVQNNLQIGGHNLIKNTPNILLQGSDHNNHSCSFLADGANFQYVELAPNYDGNIYGWVQCSEKLRQGKTYTISFEFWNDSGSPVGFYWYPSEKYAKGGYIPSIAGKWQKVTFTYEQSGATTEANHNRLFGFCDLKGGVRYSYTRLKLEEGKVATAWSPSVTGDYSTTTQMNSAITQKANEITSSVTALSNRVQTAESTITQQANQITTKVDVNGVKSTITQSAEEVKVAFNKVSSSVVQILTDGLAITHSDGSYSWFRREGNTHYIAGSHRKYHSLMVAGSVSATDSWGQISIRITLPSEFKGKAFEVLPSLVHVGFDRGVAHAFKNLNISVHDFNYSTGQFSMTCSPIGVDVQGAHTVNASTVRVSYIAIA